VSPDRPPHTRARAAWLTIPTMIHNDRRSLTVLLLEDNPTHAHLIRRHLQKAAGAAVKLCHVERLSAALEFLNHHEVDSLLLDLSLGDSQIHETLARVIEKHGDVPIVVLTSLDDLDFATQAVSQGAQDYLVKSQLSGELLLRSIHYAIERKNVQDKLESYAAELERSNERLKGFAHTVAHEVMSPLNVVAYCLATLEQKFGERFDDQSREIVADAGGAIRGMTELVNELLAFARVGGDDQTFGEVDAEAVFYQAYAYLHPAIKEAGATVVHDPLPVVRGNEIHLRQLLQNLIANAVKYRRDEPLQIHVSAEEQNARWTFSVRDNARGIAREDQQRIFDAFVRLHDQAQIPGTGIGLALCKRIVEHHGGQIWVESVPAHGSTFYFTLPKIQSKDRCHSLAAIRPRWSQGVQ